MNLRESIYLMLLKNELDKNDKNPYMAFYEIDKEKSKKENCDVVSFSKRNLIELANDLANEFDKKEENVILD